MVAVEGFKLFSILWSLATFVLFGTNPFRISGRSGKESCIWTFLNDPSHTCSFGWTCLPPQSVVWVLVQGYLFNRVTFFLFRELSRRPTKPLGACSPASDGSCWYLDSIYCDFIRFYFSGSSVVVLSWSLRIANRWAATTKCIEKEIEKKIENFI